MLETLLDFGKELVKVVGGRFVGKVEEDYRIVSILHKLNINKLEDTYDSIYTHTFTITKFTCSMCKLIFVKY